MSYYVYGSGISYQQYLQAKSFVADISSASRKAGREVSMQISRQTREVIASNEALARENMRVSERQHRERLDAIDAESDRITGALSEGFDRISYQLQDISSGISELNATFHWGFSQMIAGIGHMNDALSELIKIAKTPVQTVAFNHFEIARDAFRQGLYQEALEELQKSIQGDHTSPGYKLEWRFHQMAGTIRLGFVDCDLSLVDLSQAEEIFLLAARYAKTDYPADAARAFLSAGWAAYCQGKMKEALAHTEQAIALSPKLTEALFQAAKVRMALGEVDSALPILRQAIDGDRFYILKAAGDGDFQKHDERVRNFIEALRLEKYRPLALKMQASLKDSEPWLSRKLPQDEAINCVATLKEFLENKSIPLLDLIGLSGDFLEAVNEVDVLDQKWRESQKIKERAGTTLEKISFWLKHSPEAKKSDDLQRIEAFLAEGENYPLLNILAAMPGLDTAIEKLPAKAKNEIIILSTQLVGVSYEAIIKPASLFRKAETVTKNLDMIRDDIYLGTGELITSIEFCQIPKGQFMMGERGSQLEVTISQDFYLGKYPITQWQWQSVMGNNPSRFKGDLNLPVENVSWDDCQSFINKLNNWVGKTMYHLPTEEEWEYACRAGTMTKYYFGDSLNQLGQYAWYDENSSDKTHPVGLLKPNTWGLYDMLGNVWEWTGSWYDENREARVVRGGSWSNYYTGGDYRCANRFINYLPGQRDNNLGFRVVRSAQF